MPTKKSTKNKEEQIPQSIQKRLTLFIRRAKKAFQVRERGFLARRPHRSFRNTRRRDYVRSLKLPGYWSFTNHVRKTLWQHKKLFLWLMFLYGAMTAALLGLASQDTYTQLGDLLRQTGGDVFKGNWGEIGQAALLLATGVAGELNVSLTESQQIYAVILMFFTWLTTVWLLRALLAGRKPKLRDALYNAGAPILPTLMIVLLLAIQLIPIAIAAIGVGVLLPYGMIDAGVIAMIFWVAVVLLVMLSLYWVTSTLIALVVVTLPGMYPMQALRAAGDLVVGRRLRILFRLLWLLIIVAMGWFVVMVPVILFDAWLKGVLPMISWLPVVPLALLVMGTVTIIWSASYIYLFYRRVVDDDAAPA